MYFVFVYCVFLSSLQYFVFREHRRLLWLKVIFIESSINVSNVTLYFVGIKIVFLGVLGSKFGATSDQSTTNEFKVRG
jgi:hypothetical protein